MIFVLFHSNGETEPVTVTGIEGDVTDIILPSVGDIVRHRNSRGEPFQGKVTERQLVYNIKNGVAVDGVVSVTLCLDRTVVHKSRSRHPNHLDANTSDRPHRLEQGPLSQARKQGPVLRCGDLG